MEEGLDFPYAYDRVWDTALSIIKVVGWNVVHENKESGQIEMHVAMDLITWSEIFYLNFTKTDETVTRVVMGRAGLAQPLDRGIARQHIEQFLLKLASSVSDAGHDDGAAAGI